MYWKNNIKMTDEEDQQVKLLREAGCKCDLPLLGYIPDQGPRCRMCGIEVTDSRKGYLNMLVSKYPQYKYSADKMPFPRLLQDVAVLLFMLQDVKSDLSLETRRKLKQLSELGYTDG